MSARPYMIGGSPWPGLSKLIEEAGEVLQVAGKLIATGGEDDHWDGTDLGDRLTDELADLMAAIRFVVDANPRINKRDITRRTQTKIALFNKWHEEGPFDG